MRSAPQKRGAKEACAVCRIALGAAITLSATACTTVLGIDGNYVVRSDVGSDKGGAGQDAGASGGEGGTGGTGGAGDGGAAAIDSGETGSGGAAGSGDGGAAGGGAGGTVVDSGIDPGCRAGSYSGSIKGSHKPSFTVVAVPLGITGTLTFDLTGTGGALQISRGAVHGTLAQIGPFDWTLDGTYDCATHQLSGHVTGKVGVVPIDGTLTGDLLSSSDKARPWSEQEQGSSLYSGSGTWNAK